MNRPTPTFFFYDLETSGLDPRRHRIMQFAGQRTDMNLQPIGDPINIMVSLSDDVLPDPQAILVTGITPQKTREEGYSEAEFAQLLHDKVATPGTIIVGFNSVRFDDEFMRHTLYRNFHDPYEWQWKDDRSRWDLLDVVRMTRALRPEGITWPVDAEGRPTNRLELLSAANGLEHTQAHDALSDVVALIAIAKLIKTKQPKLFEFLLTNRSKHDLSKLVNLDAPQPFVYTSGRYPKEHMHTTIAVPVAEGSRPGTLVVYDLRADPADWADKSAKDLRDSRFATREKRQAPGFLPLPAKEIALNKCPTVAPLGVLDDATQQRLGLDLAQIQANLAKLKQSDLPARLAEAFGGAKGFPKASDVDASIYDGFIGDADKSHMRAIRSATNKDLATFRPNFRDERLSPLLLRYKARNFPAVLNDDERMAWEEYRAKRFHEDVAPFMAQLNRFAASAANNDEHQFLLQELQLWAESIAPSTD